MKNKNKNKLVNEDVKIPFDKLEELEKILNSTISRQSKIHVMYRIAGGNCLVCRDIPSKIVKYDYGDGLGERIERYCAKCFERWVSNATRTFT